MKRITYAVFLFCSLTLMASARDDFVFENNFEKLPVGKLPDEFRVLNGDFAIMQDGTNKVLELPGAPLDTFTVLFGPDSTTNLSATVRVLGTNKGRRYPTFGVGLCGLGGYRLQVSPAKRAVELYHGEQAVTNAPYSWTPGQWVRLRLQVRAVGDDWMIEGKVWMASAQEPTAWTITFNAPNKPATGRASLWGSPFSGTPIQYDDLALERLGTR